MAPVLTVHGPHAQPRVVGLDRAEARQIGDVNEATGLLHPALHEVDQRGAAGHEPRGRVMRNRVDGLGHLVG
jgi:hypothetical protein